MEVLKWYFLLASVLTVIFIENSLTSLQEDVSAIISLDINDTISGFLDHKLELLNLLKEIRKGNFDQPVVLNRFVDITFKSLNRIIKISHIEPVPMPGFERPVPGTFFNGWVGLTNGRLRGISTMQREGDVSAKFEYPNLNFRAGIGLESLEFDYNYKATLFGLGPQGIVEGGTRRSKIMVDFEINVTNLNFKMNNLVLSVGELTINFTGSITGEIINVLSGIVLPVLSRIIDTVLEAVVTAGLEKAIDAYNEVVCRIMILGCPWQTLLGTSQ